jgi:hypothetical protein
MADQVDVETLLVSLAADALYPNGVTAPSAIGPICRIYRGWPTPAALDVDLAAGRVNVTVFPIDAGGRTTTRYPDCWFPTVAPPPALTVSTTATTATFAGTAAAGQVAGLRVDDQTYVYRVQEADTPASIAASVGLLVRSNRVVTVAGSSVAVPGAGTFVARVVADATVMQEVRRQAKDFRLTCWCPTPALRDSVVAAIDLRFAPLRFITFADGSGGRLLFAGSTVFDQSENATLYRRDLVYTVEYPTILSATQPAMLFGDGTLEGVTFVA